MIRDALGNGGKELRPLGEAEPQAEEAANDPEADS